MKSIIKNNADNEVTVTQKTIITSICIRYTMKQDMLICQLNLTRVALKVCVHAYDVCLILNQCIIISAGKLEEVDYIHPWFNRMQLFLSFQNSKVVANVLTEIQVVSAAMEGCSKSSLLQNY